MSKHTPNPWKDIVQDLLKTLQEIANLDPQTDSPEWFNEWGESDCFRQAQAKARVAIAKFKRN